MKYQLHMKQILYFILAFLFLGSCKKYPDDEKKIHFRFVMDRLCKDWRLKTVTSLSTGSSMPYVSADELTFEDDGQLTGGSPTIMGSSMYSTPLILGGWDFTDDKKTGLVLTEWQSSEQHFFTILQLDPGELKLRNDTAEFFFGKK